MFEFIKALNLASNKRNVGVANVWRQTLNDEELVMINLLL